VAVEAGLGPFVLGPDLDLGDLVQTYDLIAAMGHDDGPETFGSVQLTPGPDREFAGGAFDPAAGNFRVFPADGTFNVLHRQVVGSHL